MPTQSFHAYPRYETPTSSAGNKEGDFATVNEVITEAKGNETII